MTLFLAQRSMTSCCHLLVSGAALGIALEQAHLRGGDVGSFNLLAAQRASWHFPGNSRF
jgi:hypothetical protein